MALVVSDYKITVDGIPFILSEYSHRDIAEQTTLNGETNTNTNLLLVKIRLISFGLCHKLITLY